MKKKKANNHHPIKIEVTCQYCHEKFNILDIDQIRIHTHQEKLNKIPIQHYVKKNLYIPEILVIQTDTIVLNKTFIEELYIFQNKFKLR